MVQTCLYFYCASITHYRKVNKNEHTHSIYVLRKPKIYITFTAQKIYIINMSYVCTETLRVYTDKRTLLQRKISFFNIRLLFMLLHS